MLEIRDLQTSYGRSQVLFGVNLDIGPKEVVSLLGRNGMGKTTTVRSIMGITPARGGTISFQGKPIQRLASYRVATRFSRTVRFGKTWSPPRARGLGISSAFLRCSGI